MTHFPSYEKEEIPVQCHICRLMENCRTPFMNPDESSLYHLGDDAQCDLLIVGEAPGSQEDEQGVPFIGQSGVLLREAVMEAGLEQFGVVYTNACRCRPDNNKTPNKKQIKACYDAFLLRDIKYYEPKVIILLGNVPLGSVLGESGITNWHGTVIDWSYGDMGDVFVIPVFHPAYVLRNMTVLEDFVTDLEKAYSVLSGKEKHVCVADEYLVYNHVGSKTELILRESVEAGSLVSFDTETTSLRMFDEGEDIIVASFAVNKPRKIAWVTDDWDTVKRILEDKDIPKVGHNIKFDIKSSYALLGHWVSGVVGDSMLLSYMLDPVPGRHGLKVLAGRHLGMYDYDKGLNEYTSANKKADPRRGGSFANVPLEILADYAAKDAIATLELHDQFYAELTDAQKTLYDELIMPANDMLANMESNGCAIDEAVVEDYIELYGETRQEQYDLMMEDATIQQYIADRLEGAGHSITKKGRVKWKRNAKFVFNPNSPVQMREVLFGDDYFGFPTVGKTNTGLDSTKWDLVKVYLDESPSFLGPYRYWKLLSKMLSTYLKPVLGRWCSSGDGRARAQYNLHGTRTGRLSSSQPNLQNIPTPEKEPGTILETHPIKNIFTHTWEGGCVLAVDYSGMELRTMASVSGCKGMTQAFEDNVDVHSYVTSLLYGIKRKDFTESEWKAKRYRAKWVNWSLLFGGSWYTLHNIYGIPEVEAKRLVDAYYGQFPEILEYKDVTLAFARVHGYVESMFGRRRYLPYINDGNRSMRSHEERSALNMPIQSAASDVLVAAMIVIDDLMREQDFQSLMVNTVHDSIMFDVYPGELDDLVHLCVDVMENLPHDYAEEYFPGLDFSWFTVPLKADVEVGSHYGSVKHYEVE